MPEGSTLPDVPRFTMYFQLKRSCAAKIMNTSVNSRIKKRKTSLVISKASRMMKRTHLNMKLLTMIAPSLNKNVLARVNSFVTWMRS